MSESFECFECGKKVTGTAWAFCQSTNPNDEEAHPLCSACDPLHIGVEIPAKIKAVQYYAGNLALQSETFVVPIRECGLIWQYMKSQGMMAQGSYWYGIFGAFHRAQRNHDSTVNIYTAGVSTGAFANIIHAALEYEGAPEDWTPVDFSIDVRTDQRVVK